MTSSKQISSLEVISALLQCSSERIAWLASEKIITLREKLYYQMQELQVSYNPLKKSVSSSKTLNGGKDTPPTK